MMVHGVPFSLTEVVALPPPLPVEKGNKGMSMSVSERKDRKRWDRDIHCSSHSPQERTLQVLVRVPS